MIRAALDLSSVNKIMVHNRFKEIMLFNQTELRNIIKEQQEIVDKQKIESGLTLNLPDTVYNANTGVERVLKTKTNLVALMDYYNLTIGVCCISDELIFSGFPDVGRDSDILQAVTSHLISICNLHGLNDLVVKDQLLTIIDENKINNVKQWFESTAINILPPVNPIHQLAAILCNCPTDEDGRGGAADFAWTKIALEKWLIQCCVGVLNSEQFQPRALDLVLTLCGNQGVGKTRFLRALIPKDLKSYFEEGLTLDTSSNGGGKDSQLLALSSWIVELGELDGTVSRSGAAQLKAFLSQRHDKIRKPYGKSVVKKIRQTSFCASVNHSQFISDETGGRRFLPLFINANITLGNFDVEGLWKYAWQLMKSGKKPYIASSVSPNNTAVENEECLMHAEILSHCQIDHSRGSDDYLRDVIESSFDFSCDSRVFVTTVGVVEHLIENWGSIMPTTFKNYQVLAKAMEDLGINRTRKFGKGRGYELPPMNFNMR